MEEQAIKWVEGPFTTNRASMRSALRNMRRSVRPASSIQLLEHPLTHIRTPYGTKVLARRRAARKVAHESRRRNR